MEVSLHNTAGITPYLEDTSLVRPHLRITLGASRTREGGLKPMYSRDNPHTRSGKCMTIWWTRLGKHHMEVIHCNCMHTFVCSDVQPISFFNL